MQVGRDGLEQRLLRLFAEDGRADDERRRFVALVAMFAALPPPPDPGGRFPDYRRLRASLLASLDGAEWEAAEERFLELYAHLHMSSAPYSEDERRRLDRAGGYWGHAGGVSPILEAASRLGSNSVSIDLGAGNGLQLLLVQRLRPHRRSIQVEISSRMAAIGRRLQGWLGIPAERVEWRVGDVLEASVAGADLVYLYRPVRPIGAGRAFYEQLAAELEAATHPVTVLSVADCLGDFLSSRFACLRDDGHLRVFRGP